MSVHLSDKDLLFLIDRELSADDAAAAREHIAVCPPCRSRVTEIENALARVVDLHEHHLQSNQVASPESRASFKTRLSAASSAPHRGKSVGFRAGVSRQLVAASVALVLVAGSLWATRYFAVRRPNSGVLQAEAVALPRRALTPGATRAIRMEELCTSAPLDNDPPVNPSLQQAVFSEYGLPDSSRNGYALDYLITPALGGADNIQNLWPQPYSSTWNARVKDQLEDHLHQMVCQGKVQLATAQNEIADDWIAAYKRYFNTDRPQQDAATLASRIPDSDDPDNSTNRHRLRSIAFRGVRHSDAM